MAQDLEKQFLNTLNYCFLEQLTLKYATGEAGLKLHPLELVEEITTVESLTNSEHNIITFSILHEIIIPKICTEQDFNQIEEANQKEREKSKKHEKIKILRFRMEST